MKNLRAIATAVYGGDCEDIRTPRKMTWSVVRGTNKNDLMVDPDIPVVSRIIGPGHATIVEAVGEFLTLVKSVVQMQRSAGVPQAVPVVYGSSVEIQAKDLVLQLIQHYHAELGEVVAFSNPACIAHLLQQTPSLKEQVLQKEILKIVLQKLMQNVTPSGALQYEIRDYACAGSGVDWDIPPGAILLQGDNAQERTELTNKIISPDLRGRFDAAYMAVLQQRDDMRPELENIVREVARQFVAYGTVSRDEKGNIINRFISAATVPELTATADIRNFIFLDAGLRKVYGEEFMKCHDIRHNVWFKTSLDKPNPPFADIAGTFIADQCDARDGTKPTAVMTERGN